MKWHTVAIAALAHDLPERVVRSEELEARLEPVYQRLRVSAGRLELMSGIRERRHYELGSSAARPSSIAARAGERALARAEAGGLARERIGLLVHSSVCRDFLEPATASVVHHALRLAPTCQLFDLSNACLGFANSMALAATWIEAGAIEAALVVAGEDGAPLVEATLRALLEAPKVDRRALKLAFASLTIGSGGAAVVLTRDSLAPKAPRLLAGATLAATEHHVLCQGDQAAGHSGPLMVTDSEALLEAGNALARRTFADFLNQSGWSRGSIERVVTHQVGSAHRRLLFESLELDPALDCPTVERLGNIGSVSLPLSWSLALEQGLARPGERTALLGIGSGLNCQMLAVH